MRSSKALNYLDKQGHRFVAGALASAYATLRKRQFTRIYWKNGLWIQRDLAGYKVDRSIVWDEGLAELSLWTEDLFLYKYQPRTGDVVIDIGAGIGGEAVHLSSLLGEGGRVFALEAHPDTFACLEESVRLNRASTVIPLQLAAAAEKGTLFIETTDNYLANSVSASSGDCEVKAMSIDDLVLEQGLQKVDFIKMNIEGAEVDALRGMVSTLKHCDRLAISCHDFLADRGGDNSFRTKERVCAFLKDFGYELSFRDDDPREWVRDFVYAVRS